MTAAPPAAAPPGALPGAGAVMARAAGENFPVASRVLPRAVRGHLLAIYGFARLVDDTGDEAAGDRLALLDELDAEIDRLYGGTPRHPLMRRLQPTVRACALPPEPLRRLVEANRRDQQVARYATFEDLLGYCALSADPVGRLVLLVLDAATPERMRMSDRVCTALQLVEHWQDVREDAVRGRVYLPQEDLARFGVAEADLRRAAATPAVRALVAFEVARTRQILAEGAPLVRALRGRARLAVAAYVAGGAAALDAIAHAGHDVLGAAPRPTARMRAAALARALGGRA